MNQALWVAKTGLDAQQTRMAVVSNNLANVNTTGFKQGRAVFEAISKAGVVADWREPDVTRIAPGTAMAEEATDLLGET